MTNSPMLAEKMKEFQCSREHRHVMLTNGRAQKCQVYPDEFCRLVCKTVMKEQKPERIQNNQHVERGSERTEHH